MLRTAKGLPFILIFLTFFNAKFSFANTTKELAEAEISQSLKGTKMTSPSEVQLSGIIQMQTTEIQKQGRDWKYLLGISYLSQSMKNSTQAADYRFKEEEVKQSLPVLSFGFLNNEDSYRFGIVTELGYSSQDLQANFKSGLVEKDIHLNSTWLAFLGLLQKNWGAWQHSAKLGLATSLTSQSSSNSYLTDFESPSFAVAGYELAYAFTSNFSLNAEARLNSQISNSKWQLDSNSLGVGATAKW